MGTYGKLRGLVGLLSELHSQENDVSQLCANRTWDPKQGADARCVRILVCYRRLLMSIWPHRGAAVNPTFTTTFFNVSRLRRGEPQHAASANGRRGAHPSIESDSGSVTYVASGDASSVSVQGVAGRKIYSAARSDVLLSLTSCGSSSISPLKAGAAGIGSVCSVHGLHVSRSLS